MKTKIFHTLIARSLAMFALTVSIMAQGIGTVEHEMKYGREYFEARKYDMAIMYFENALKKDPEHAEANFLIGVCYVKLSKAEAARPYLEKAARLNDDYRSAVQKFYAKPDGAAETGTPTRGSSKDPKTGEEISEYEVGNTVEVFYAGQWNPGRVIAVEGRGRSVFAEVEYEFQGDGRTGKFFYNAIRHAAAKPIPKKSDPGKGGGLTLGEYGCSSKAWNGGGWTFTPRGSFKLLASGRYTQTNAGGTYKYNAATKEIAFTDGFFGNSNAKGKVIGSEQIDIEFDKSYWWTCALQK